MIYLINNFKNLLLFSIVILSFNNCKKNKDLEGNESNDITNDNKINKPVNTLGKNNQAFINKEINKIKYEESYEGPGTKPKYENNFNNLSKFKKFMVERQGKLSYDFILDKINILNKENNNYIEIDNPKLGNKECKQFYIKLEKTQGKINILVHLQIYVKHKPIMVKKSDRDDKRYFDKEVVRVRR